MEDNIEKIKKRIDFIKTELIMRNYSDGWTIEGFEIELAALEVQLKILTNK
jgi:hypothetical protein